MWCSSCSGTTTVVRLGLGGGDARLALLGAPLRELLLTGEREDAVGFLREVDGTDAREDGHEVDGA